MRTAHGGGRGGRGWGGGGGGERFAPEREKLTGKKGVPRIFSAEKLRGNRGGAGRPYDPRGGKEWKRDTLHVQERGLEGQWGSPKCKKETQKKELLNSPGGEKLQHWNGNDRGPVNEEKKENRIESKRWERKFRNTNMKNR